jgi:diacylglycerol kinase family enzyme
MHLASLHVDGHRGPRFYTLGLSTSPTVAVFERAASHETPVFARAVPSTAPLFIVLNRGSGKHEQADVRLAIEEALTNAGRTFSIHEVDETTELGQLAAQVVAEARSRAGVVVAAGGDGTINTVAAATLGSGCPFGVLPLGTFNYFSRAHGIPADMVAACGILLEGQAFEVQVGLVNDRVFLVNGSLGVYPELLEEREQAKRRLGRSRWVAVLAALRSLLRHHRRLRLDIEAKTGRQSVVTNTLFVGNNRLQLRRFGIPDGELVEHHRLIAVMVRPVGVLGMLGLLGRALFGRLGDAEEVTSFDFERMTVRPRFGQRRIKVATDGEVEFLPVPLTFRVAPDSLWLLRPAEPGEDPG